MPDSNCKCLESALGPVVVVVAAYAVDVEGSARCLREALQAMGNHLTAQITNLLPLETQFNNAVWPVR